MADGQNSFRRGVFKGTFVGRKFVSDKNFGKLKSRFPENEYHVLVKAFMTTKSFMMSRDTILGPDCSPEQLEIAETGYSRGMYCHASCFVPTLEEWNDPNMWESSITVVSASDPEEEALDAMHAALEKSGVCVIKM
jgi:hypothetical protein